MREHETSSSRPKHSFQSPFPSQALRSQAFRTTILDSGHISPITDPRGGSVASTIARLVLAVLPARGCDVVLLAVGPEVE